MPFALQYTRAVFQAIVKDPVKATPKKKSPMKKENDSEKKPADPASSQPTSEQEKTSSEQDKTPGKDKQSDDPPLTIPTLLPLMHSETAEGLYTRMTVVPCCVGRTQLLVYFSSRSAQTLPSAAWAQIQETWRQETPGESFP